MHCYVTFVCRSVGNKITVPITNSNYQQWQPGAKCQTTVIYHSLSIYILKVYGKKLTLISWWLETIFQFSKILEHRQSVESFVMWESHCNSFNREKSTFLITKSTFIITKLHARYKECMCIKDKWNIHFVLKALSKIMHSLCDHRLNFTVILVESLWMLYCL